MKISDSLGNLYTHTMFKKKSYEMKDDADEITVAVPSKSKHKAYSDEEDEDDESVTSDQSEDSISTKSSPKQMARRQSERKSTSRGRHVSKIPVDCFMISGNCGKLVICIGSKRRFGLKSFEIKSEKVSKLDQIAKSVQKVKEDMSTKFMLFAVHFLEDGVNVF